MKFERDVVRDGRYIKKGRGQSLSKEKPMPPDILDTIRQRKMGISLARMCCGKRVVF
jgi:hypothetical protein